MSVWDRLLIENSDKIGKLYTRTYQAEKDAAEVERQLSRVEEQQEELGAWLDKYETDVDEMVARMGGNVGGDGVDGLGAVDQERERVYRAAGKLSERLGGFSKDLGDVIGEINDVGNRLGKGGKGDDPVCVSSLVLAQALLTFVLQLESVVRILNTHLQSLQQIDMGAQGLHAKVEAARAEQSAAFGRSGRGANGNSSAADDFYRSFVGGRR